MKDRLSRLWNLRAAWAPWVLLLAFAAFKTSDIWRNLSTRHYALKGAFMDTVCTSWFSWWIGEAIWDGRHTLMFSDLINFPHGATTPLDYSLTFAHAWLAGLIQPLLGAVVAHNLVAIFGFVLTLVAFFLLLREVSGSTLLSSILSILVVSFGLAGDNCLPDPELIFVAWLGFSLLAWQRYLGAGRLGWLLASALLVGFTCYAQMYYGMAVLATLAAAALLGFGGVTFQDVPAETLLKRTLAVLGAGLALAVMFHARNILNVLQAGSLGHMQKDIDILWPYSVVDGLLLLAGVAAPAVAGLLLKSPDALTWALLALPVAVASLGFALDVPSQDIPRTMPLGWARDHLPFLWRLSFPTRFVGPLLLGIALSYAALWRGLRPSPGPSSGRFPHVKPLLAGALTVAAFWATSAFLPLTPDTLGASGPVAPDAASKPTPQGPTCYLAQMEMEAPGASPWRIAGQTTPGPRSRFHADVLLWPFVPLRTVEPPAVPECIAQVASEDGEFAILDLTQDHLLKPLFHYFQTIHGKAIAGYPCRFRWMDEQRTDPSELTLIQHDFEFGNLDRLPPPEMLRKLGVRYVVHSELQAPREPGGIPCIRPDVDPAVERRPRRWFDFEATYGKARCVDSVVRVYATEAP